MKSFLFLISSLIGFQAFAISCGSDLIISYLPRTETQACTTAGVCNAYDFNPETNQFEEFQGLHASCPGQQTRTIEEWTCQRQDFTTYPESQEGVWGFCEITY